MLKLYYNNNFLEVGCDEAGRGALAGPVFAAAVILPSDFNVPLLNDSKKLSEKKRYELREKILQQAIDWAVAYVDNTQIDKINILNASIEAMHRALDKLKVRPQFILIDGNKFYKYRNIPHKTIVKGDALYASIAAASILAKTFRDDYMKELHKKFPQYNWYKNKGYPTKEHKKSIFYHGLTNYHRKTFCSFFYEKKLF